MTSPAKIALLATERFHRKHLPPVLRALSFLRVEIVNRLPLLHIAPWHIWKWLWRSPGQRIGLFRNRPGVIRRKPGQWLPRRWGFYILGFEFGRRG